MSNDTKSKIILFRHFYKEFVKGHNTDVNNTGEK